MRPKVSVIIPVYNVEKYLDRCVQSVINQTLTDIEIILVDDGSPDNCPKMCDEYAAVDKRIKVIHKKNAGLGYARNSGLERANGEFVAFVDSDDFIDVNMYERLYETAVKYGLDTCYCGFKYYIDGKIVQRREVENFQLFRGRKDIDRFLLDMIGPPPPYPHEVKYLMSVWRAIYSNALINSKQLFFDSEKQIASEDILFHLKYLPETKNIGFLPDCYYYYCTNLSSISRTYDDSKYRLIRANLIEVKNRLELLYLEDCYLPHYNRYLFLVLRTVLYNEFSRSNLSIMQRYNIIKDRCNDKVFDVLYKRFQYSYLPIKKKVFFVSCKEHCIFFIMILLFFLQMHHNK